MPSAKSGRRAAVSHDKGKVLYRGRFVPVQLRPFPTTAEQFADHLIQLIETGELTPGTELPGRPELAQTYYPGHTINQAAMRDALYILAFRGYVSLGTEYLHTHRYIVTKPIRYTSRRPGMDQGWSPAVRTELLDLSTFYQTPAKPGEPAAPPLVWEPVYLKAEIVSKIFKADFESRNGGSNIQAFHFMDRIWSARECVAVHHTWVYPASELAMSIVNRMAMHSSATLADIEPFLAVAQTREALTVEVANAEQRGDFLVGSKWTAPFALAVIQRRAYNAAHAFIFGQTSWYRADRFTFESEYQHPSSRLPEP